jgi:hypothetical protein
MLTGKKSVPQAQVVAASGVGVLRFLAALAISGVVVWGVSSGMQYFSPVHTVPAVATPNW